MNGLADEDAAICANEMKGYLGSVKEVAEGLERQEVGEFNEPAWTGLISPPQWAICKRAIDALRGEKVDFLLGGAYGLALYTGRLRDTKDADFFILPEHAPRAAAALARAGFEDYYPKVAYDRRWIYRSTSDNFIVDLIFRMANRRADIDDVWFERSHEITIHGDKLRVIPAEEMLWQKMYVMQRDRCDWPDVINILYVSGHLLDWEHLINRARDDEALLFGILHMFEWLCPDRAGKIPAFVRARAGLPPAMLGQDDEVTRVRATLLDSRGWFAPLGQATDLLQV
ncbi:MAG: nucleotidyltransferase [Limisphaerales bacterium]